jgi:hypothetical protein
VDWIGAHVRGVTRALSWICNELHAIPPEVTNSWFIINVTHVFLLSLKNYVIIILS